MAQGRRTAIKIELSDEEFFTLERWQRSTVISAGKARRGRIILMVAKGMSLSQISREAGTSRRYIYKWTHRFQKQGIEGLNDKLGRGAKKSLATIMGWAGYANEVTGD
jgi:hypothetical protein